MSIIILQRRELWFAWEEYALQARRRKRAIARSRRNTPKWERKKRNPQEHKRRKYRLIRED